MQLRDVDDQLTSKTLSWPATPQSSRDLNGLVRQ